MAKRKGKYADVIGLLPRHPGVEPERRDIVEATKTAILEPPSEENPGHDQGASGMLLKFEVEDIDAAFKRIITMEKRATAGRPWASEFARVYAELRSVKDKLAGWESSINLLIEAYQLLWVEQMEVEGMTSLQLANGQPVSFFLEPYAQVTNKEECRRWCIDDGLANEMVLPWMILNSLVKKRLLAGLDLPDGVVCYAKTKVRLGSD